jgi:hypothetical protein
MKSKRKWVDSIYINWKDIHSFNDTEITQESSTACPLAETSVYINQDYNFNLAIVAECSLKLRFARIPREWDAVTDVLKPCCEEDHPLEPKSESSMFN